MEKANSEFYRAFESGELARMEQVWVQAPHVRCVHPGWDLLEGWDAVRESWGQLLSTDHQMTFEIDHLVVRQFDRCGWVSCIERIARPAGGSVLVDSVLATNVFERTDDDRWLMVSHHASPILRSTQQVRHTIN